MIKKSLLAAALLIAGGTAVNAAEIGVQSTWGYSDTQITNGQYRSTTTSASAYAERSRVDVFGWNQYGETTSTTDVAGEGVEYVLVDDINVTETKAEVVGDGKYRYVDVALLDGGLEGLNVREGQSTTTTTSGESGGQVSWARAGRIELGGSFSRTTDNYDYTGTRTSGFSGVTAFTR